MYNETIKKSAVFGLTFHGRQFVRRYVRKGLKLTVILDNDPGRDGEKFCNIPIVLPRPSILSEIEQYFVIGRYAIEHKQQLMDLGIPDNRIKHVPRSEIALKGETLIKRDGITMSYIKAISEACVSCGCSVYLDSSGLLAAARNDALGELSDVDLLIGSGSILALETALKQIKKDWIIQSNIDPLEPDDKSQIVIMSGKLMETSEEPAVIDIRAPKLNPKLLEEPKLIASHFNHFSKVFGSTSIKFPYRYEDYLEVLYGPNWKIPDQFYRP